MRIWMFLPAFNEERSLERLLPKIKEALGKRGFDYRIVVVNDGSTDATADVLKRAGDDYPLDVVNHPINRGLGETERDGFEFVACRAADDDVMVRFDCDDTHDPEYTAALLEKLRKGYDVVNTSRFQPGGGQVGVGAYRAAVSRCANLFMKLVFNIHGVRDFSCGFRAYRAKVIKDALKIYGNGFIQLKGLGFTSTLETVVKLKLMGCRFAEIPFVLRYDQKASSSKMVGSVTTLGYFIMAILYHWPFGGWRNFYRDLGENYQASPEEACRKYSILNLIRSGTCQIGG